MTVSAASSSRPASSRYHHRLWRRSDSSRVISCGGGRLASADLRRVAGHRRDQLARVDRRQVRLGRVEVDGDRFGPPGRRARRAGLRRRPARSARAALRCPRRRRLRVMRSPDGVTTMRSTVARPLARAVEVEHLTDREPRGRRLVVREVAHELMHERQEHRLHARCRSTSRRASTSRRSTRPAPTFRSAAATAPSSNRARTRSVGLGLAARGSGRRARRRSRRCAAP